MQTLDNPDAILDFCLAPLGAQAATPAGQEARRRLEHVIRTYRKMLPRPVAVDFAAMPTLVINEAAHGYE